MSHLEGDLRDQFSREAAAVAALPRDLWLRITEESSAGVPTWLRMVPVAVVLVFLGATGIVLARSQRATPVGRGPVAAASPTPARHATPHASATPKAAPSAPTYECGATPSGGSPSAGGNLVAVRVGHQVGYDRITFEFAGPAVPVYAVTQQPGTRFTQDASGRTVDLQGVAGLKVVFKGASGQGTYTGSGDIKLGPGGVPDKSALVEVRSIGDFERVLSWAVGLNVKPACLLVHEYAGPPRLAIDIQDNL